MRFLSSSEKRKLADNVSGLDLRASALKEQVLDATGGKEHGKANMLYDRKRRTANDTDRKRHMLQDDEYLRKLADIPKR